MVNKNYVNGVRRERQIVNKARAEGKISFRSAGSHSPIDCCIIDLKYRRIEFIQVKNKKIYGKEKKPLEDLKLNSDEYYVEFKSWTIDDLIDKRKKKFKNIPSPEMVKPESNPG